MLPRTYSRRHRRQRQLSAVLSDTSPERGTSPPLRKRRRIQVEAVQSQPGASLDISGDSDAEYPSSSHRRTVSKDILSDHAASSRSPRSSRQSSRQSTTKTTVQTPSRMLKTSRARGTPQRIVSSSDHPSNKSAAPSSSQNTALLLPSPEKSTKDLTDLFSFVEAPKFLSAKPVSKSGGVAKRMLRRTKTDPSAGMSSTDNTPSDSPTPSKIDRTRTESLLDMDCPVTQPSTPSKHGSFEDPSLAKSSLAGTTSNVRTYGGKSRSFLVTLGPGNQSFGDIPTGEISEDEFAIRESYNDLRQRWGVDNSEDDPYPEPPMPISPGDRKRKGKDRQVDAPVVHLPTGMMNDLKSITELRSKGESRRFLDDVGYLFEGLEAEAALSVRRGSAIEIVAKMCDPDFARKAKAADFLGRTWDALREAGGGSGDKVLDTVLVFFSALVARDPRDLLELALKPDFVTTLFNLLSTLDKNFDPLWLLSCGLNDTDLKQAGISKVDKKLLSEIHIMVLRRSELFEDERAISNRLLVVHVLSVLPPQLLPTASLDVVIDELLIEAEHISSRITSYASGLPLISPLSSSSLMHSFSFSHIDLCLRLLGSYLLGRWSESDETTSVMIRDVDPENTRLPSHLVAICAAAAATSRDDDLPHLRQIAYKCMESSFRVLIGLTHHSIPWCQKITQEPLILLTLVRTVVSSHRERMALIIKHEEVASETSDETDIAAQLLDRLCLALGVLTNLIQNDRAAHVPLQALKVDPSCRGDHGCSMACRCPSPSSGLDCLTSVYVEFCKLDSELDVVVRGHMAILFGLLMKSHPDVQQVVLSQLPEATEKRKLAALVDNAREFALFYVEFAKKASAIAENRDDDDVTKENAFAHDRDMGKVLRDSQGESVARDVLSFLTILRDQSRS